MMEHDAPDMTPEETAAAIKRMGRISSLGARDAVWKQQRAAEKRSRASDLAEEGDRFGARCELRETADLEQDAADILDPHSHTTAPIQIGRGGEMATGAAMTRPYLDTVRSRPDWLAHDASRERMELADRAGVLTMSLDVAETIEAGNSLEKMLAHELAAAHSLAMRMLAGAADDLTAYTKTGQQYQHRNVEACRTANAAVRLMEAYQRGLITLDRIRNGGRQVVTVQHVSVGAGGKAVVAGAIGNPGDRRE